MSKQGSGISDEQVRLTEVGSEITYDIIKLGWRLQCLICMGAIDQSASGPGRGIQGQHQGDD